MQTKPIIQTKDIFYIYRNEETGERLEVLKNVSVTIHHGEFVSIIGPSGSGKSTFLKILTGLIKPRKGEVISHAKEMSVIFQNFALFPWLTVKENIDFGLKMKGISKKEREKITKEKIEEVELIGFEKKYPSELSGGMKQRVGIARALAMNPDVLFMDEPFSSLDALTAEHLRAKLHDLWLKYKMTIVMVTHLVEEAVELSDRIIVFSQRPASVKNIVDVRLERPRDKRSQGYYDLVDQIENQIEG